MLTLPLSNPWVSTGQALWMRLELIARNLGQTQASAKGFQRPCLGLFYWLQGTVESLEMNKMWTNRMMFKIFDGCASDEIRLAILRESPICRS